MAMAPFLPSLPVRPGIRDGHPAVKPPTPGARQPDGLSSAKRSARHRHGGQHADGQDDEPPGVVPEERSRLMRFGIFGSAQARRGVPDVDSGAGFKDFVEYNVQAEALGYRSSFVVEHHFTGFGQISATLNLLTWVGARTSTLRLGTAVMVLPWHNPVLLAEQVATMDLLSNGRVDLGIGPGYRHNEFAGFCVPMEEAEERFDESVQLLIPAWTSDVPWSHRGKYWQFENGVVELPPAQKPHP